MIIILWQNDDEGGFIKVTMAKIDQVIMKNGNHDQNNDDDNKKKKKSQRQWENVVHDIALWQYVCKNNTLGNFLWKLMKRLFYFQ